MNNQAARKQVLVHLGPHKTGSSAIQKSLADASETLVEADVCFLFDAQTHKAALTLAAERFEDAEQLLSNLANVISDVPASRVILSEEDFCGPLLGRSRHRRLYPKLTKNLRTIARSLRPHDVTFAFFVRDETNWLRSCYHQHLRYGTQFHRYQDFADRYGAELSWRAQIEKPSQVFGARFVALEYQREPSAGIKALVELIKTEGAPDIDVPCCEGVNKSPTAAQIAQLERVNEVTEFGPTAKLTKSFILGKRTWNPASERDADTATWPPDVKKSDLRALPKLLQRVARRVSQQDPDDVLPPVTTDLDVLLQELMPKNVAPPNLNRTDMNHQSVILGYHLRGKSKLCHLNGLTISYLRRDTPHTDKARGLFHRIWREKGPFIINELSTRWLISTLQTFMDHGQNEAQRSIGTAGYFYANMMKIYEGERAIEGLEQNASYEHTEHRTKNYFRGLDRYNLGGTDLMLNTNALALEVAQRDAVAGLVLEEFLVRVKCSENVFSRHDRSRYQRKINLPGFKNTWSFFEEWQE